MDDINSNFKNLIKDLKDKDSNLNIPEKNKYSAIEIEKYSQYLKEEYVIDSKKKLFNL